jgi:3-phenylpropionate/trans-cinnamate dioxygenase ferredoxin subunit
VAQYKPVAKLGDFRDGIVRTFEVDGTDIAVVNHQGRFYAFGGRCTHEGYLFNWTRVRAEDLILCSSHFAYFQLATGKVISGPTNEDLRVYDVRVEGEDVLVSLEPDV